MKIRFRKFQILEWYDGVTRAIGLVKGKEYMIILAAWDMESARKVFLVTEIKKSDADQMVYYLTYPKIPVEGWDQFNEEFASYVRSYGGPVWALINGVIKENEAYDLTEVDRKCLFDLVNYDILKVINPKNLQRWFN